MRYTTPFIPACMLACLTAQPLITVAQSLTWATYYGGTDYEYCKASAVDGDGNVYLAGFTLSDTDIAAGGHQNTPGGSEDAFLVKFNAAGVRQWATYYGGSLDDEAVSCAVDADGNVYIAGQTYSSSAIADGGHQNTYGAAADAFLVKFNADGVRQWGTYYGGNGYDEGRSCAVDGSGNVYLAGHTESTSAIADGGHQNTIGGSSDAFLVKFNADGVRQWATYYGGPGEDERGTCATTAGNFVYLGGMTNSTTGINFGGSQNSLGGGNDSFVVRFDEDGVRQWATYYGGTGNEEPGQVAADGNGFVYVLGGTNSTGISHLGHQMFLGGSTDAFIVKFNAGGSRSWCTYYGGPLDDRAFHCAVDANGYVFLVGEANSLDSIATPGVLQESNAGSTDVFVAAFDQFCTRQWGTYYGGTSFDSGRHCTLEGGSLYVSGQTASSSGIASGGHQNTFGGNNDAMLLKLGSLDVGIDEAGMNAAGGLHVWPNPGNGAELWLTVDGPSGTSAAILRIRDLSGRLVHEESVRITGNASIPITGVPAGGTYAVSVTFAEGTFVQRVVIE